MKKPALLVALVLLLSVPATANSSRISSVMPSLSFSGTTANCECWIIEDSQYSYIVVTMKLMSGNTCLKTWSKAGAGSVTMSETTTVTKGQTYTLTVDVMVNGTSRPQYSVTKTC